MSIRNLSGITKGTLLDVQSASPAGWTNTNNNTYNTVTTSGAQMTSTAPKRKVRVMITNTGYMVNSVDADVIVDMQLSISLDGGSTWNVVSWIVSNIGTTPGIRVPASATGFLSGTATGSIQGRIQTQQRTGTGSNFQLANPFYCHLAVWEQ